MDYFKRQKIKTTQKFHQVILAVRKHYSNSWTTQCIFMHKLFAACKCGYTRWDPRKEKFVAAKKTTIFNFHIAATLAISVILLMIFELLRSPRKTTFEYIFFALCLGIAITGSFASVIIIFQRDTTIHVLNANIFLHRRIQTGANKIFCLAS